MAEKVDLEGLGSTESITHVDRPLPVEARRDTSRHTRMGLSHAQEDSKENNITTTVSKGYDRPGDYPGVGIAKQD